MTEPLFLTDNELADLTGRKLRKLQIEALRSMMIPFRVNALGRPVVTRAAVLGHAATKPAEASKWTPTLVA